MPRTILFTGFPGFIGARLIPRLLDDDPDAVVVALVESRMQERARALCADLPAGRVHVQPGDITQPRLGLDDATWRRLCAETVEVFHLAAVYDLAVPAAVAERVNVVGTQRVVEFCRACERLERHLYVSTAYVAGLRSGLVFEDELGADQAFKNHYETTKFAAEVVVRNSMEFDGVPTTIVRPAIVVGDSRTGETSKFDGPYYLLRTVAAIRGPLPKLGSPDALFNVVPVDFVLDAMAIAARDERALGRTLHLVDPEPLCSKDVVEILARAYDGRTPRLPVPVGLIERSMRFDAVRRFLGGTPVESLAYLNHPVRFDVSNAAEVLAPHGLRCPRFAEYAGTLVEFFRAHEDDPAYVPGG
jgi:thioester reductase-like protein